MITKEQALTVNRFHENTPRPNGTCYEWRRNGGTQTWVTRPEHFKVPVKYGMRSYDYITQDNAHEFHTEADCPMNKKDEDEAAPFTAVGSLVYDSTDDSLHPADSGDGGSTE